MMEFETWWVLAVPLFFGLGWFAARLDARQLPRARGPLPDAYFRGLNFLLNEQPDKAIDAFIDVVRLDPETIELHFALGNLFRRRGETDRAIRVHQNLAERPDLDAAQRQHAVFELGQDFLRAGLLDRAEDAFNRLEGSAYAAASLRHRLAIAQMVRDWPQAIDLARRLQADVGDGLGREIAQFHCELAAQALAGSAPDRLAIAVREIEAARAADPEHPRSWVLGGELAMAQGEPQRAIAQWQHLLVSQPACAALLARGWLKAHESTGQLPQGLAALEQAHRAQPGIDTLAAIADARLSAQGAKEALSWIEAQLRTSPSLLGFEKWLSLRRQAVAAVAGTGVAAGTGTGTGVAAGAGAGVSSGAPSAASDALSALDPELTQQLIAPQVARLSRYGCTHCGFKARQFYWQCPGCSRWDTYAPRRGDALEGAR